MITIMTLHLEILSRIIVLQRKLKLELHSRQSRVDKTADYQSIQMMKSIFDMKKIFAKQPNKFKAISRLVAIAVSRLK